VSQPSAVLARHLTKEYAPGHRALDDIELAVAPGEVVALVGSNGAGKSTLLRCLVRLLEPTSGEIVLDGVDVRAASRRELRRLRLQVGFVFQRFQLIPRLSAFHNVLLGALGRAGTRCVFPATAPDEVRTEAMACLERVGLAELAGRRVDALSGGQQQRVAIARMLLQRPRLVFADEPVASLDPVAGTGVMELLRDIAMERRLTVLVALHQLDFAMRYTDRIVGLRDGRVVLDREAECCPTTELDLVYTPDSTSQVRATVRAAS
jgi:phosphonate transport system ATP-binding protein